RGGIAYDTRLFAACLAVVAIVAVVRTDAFGYASGLWQDVRDVLDCGKTDLGFARLVHFLALAYIVYHSGLTGLMRRTRAFLPLCLIGRYGLPVFATGTVLSAVGEVVETRSEAFSHEVAFGAAIVVGGILMHYLVARGLAVWRDKSRAQQSMMNRAHTLQMASPLSLREPPIVLWPGTSRPVSQHLSFSKIISARSSGAVRTRLVCTAASAWRLAPRHLQHITADRVNQT